MAIPVYSHIVNDNKRGKLIRKLKGTFIKYFYDYGHLYLVQVRKDAKTKVRDTSFRSTQGNVQ